jgi:hypothetical protein
MRYVILLLAILFFSKISISQVYGNEWIQYNQKYYAFNVVSSGIHRLDYTSLIASGIPTNTFDPSNIQIFGRQKEIPLFIEVGNDGVFNVGDYILFYADKNDGWLDSSIYENPATIGNPKYSLYNDTIQYFFTWNNSTTNLRFELETDVNVSSYTPSDFVMFEQFEVYNDAYNESEKTSDASSSFFTSGEGWGKESVNGSKGHTWDFSSLEFKHIYQKTGAPNVEYSAVSVGTSNAKYSGKGNHHVKHTIGNSPGFAIADTVFSGFRAVHLLKSFPANSLPATGPSNFKISIIGDLNVETDFQSINYWSFVYPRKPDFAGLNKFTFNVRSNVNQNKIRIDLSNILSDACHIFVLGDTPKKLPLIPLGNNYSILIPTSVSGLTQKVVYQDKASLINVTNLTAVNGNGEFTDFSKLSPEKSLLMVYHSAFESASADYASYRKSSIGGGYNVIRSNVTELYQQFGGGVPKHIIGIRRFAHFIYNRATEKPVGLFLIGKGIREVSLGKIAAGYGTRKNAEIYADSYIPSFGQPSCDVCITSNLSINSRWTPLIPTGRISVTSNKELVNYLEKVKQYEQNQQQNSVYTSQTKDWQKHVLHFVGGSDASQQWILVNT